MTGRRGAPSGTGRSGRRSRGRGGAVVDGGIDHRLRWEGDDRLVVGPTSFDLTVDPARWAASSSADRFVLLKTRRMVEAFVRNVPDRVERVVDLGIFKGGSIALCCELFHPERIVGVDLEPARVQALDEFVDRRSLGRSVELHFGTDQGDREALTRIVEDGSGGRPLDLVVDDGSHLYTPTRASLEVLLPRLRPGGVYVIEDWGWAHWEGTRWQGPDSQYAVRGHPAVEAGPRARAGDRQPPRTDQRDHDPEQPGLPHPGGRGRPARRLRRHQVLSDGGARPPAVGPWRTGPADPVAAWRHGRTPRRR